MKLSRFTGVQRRMRIQFLSNVFGGETQELLQDVHYVEVELNKFEGYQKFIQHESHHITCQKKECAKITSIFDE